MIDRFLEHGEWVRLKATGEILVVNHDHRTTAADTADFGIETVGNPDSYSADELELAA
jgi:hypothetical protein